jgi:hypothetical protein
MRFAWLAALALVLLAGCGVETIEIERQPRSGFSDDGAALDAYDTAEQRCSKAKSLSQLAGEFSVRKPGKASADAVARAYATEDDDPEISGAVYSGCLDGIEAAKLD